MTARRAVPALAELRANVAAPHLYFLRSGSPCQSAGAGSSRLGECSGMTPERPLLRAAVAEVDDAVAECARLEELEVDTSVVCEEGFASAERHGVDEQVVLVDELVRCESRG